MKLDLLWQVSAMLKLAKKPYRLEGPTSGYKIVADAVLHGGTSL